MIAVFVKDQGSEESRHIGWLKRDYKEIDRIAAMGLRDFSTKAEPELTSFRTLGSPVETKIHTCDIPKPQSIQFKKSEFRFIISDTEAASSNTHINNLVAAKCAKFSFILDPGDLSYYRNPIDHTFVYSLQTLHMNDPDQEELLFDSNEFEPV